MKIFFLFFLAFTNVNLQAQSHNTYHSDINSLHDILQKTPSYKQQIKGKKLSDYNALLTRLKSDSNHQVNDYQYFFNLSQLFFPIKDNHLGFYQIGSFTNEDSINHINIDSLKFALASKSLDSVEGIYFYGEIYKIGIFKCNPNEYIGVVLNSSTPMWKVGQIAVHLYETLPNYFKAIYVHPKNKTLLLNQNEKYTHHALVNSYFYGSLSESIYTKTNREKDFVNLPKNIGSYQFKGISANIQYLHFKHFSANNNLMQHSQVFYDSIKHLLTAPHLIVDLRNNQGGANKVSKKFLTLLKDYVKHGQVYVLVNNGTMSQGEIFTLQLKKLDHVKILGQSTRGTLVYGSNYGKREKLPSMAFEVYITDMKGKGGKSLLPYENYGIEPDIILSDNKDWIDKTIEIIQKSM